MTKMKMIWLPFTLLLLIGSFMVLKTSIPLEDTLAYGKFHFVFNHLMHICIGIIVLILMNKVDSVWFDRIGAGALVVSVGAFILMLFYPEFHQGRVFLMIGSFSMQPLLYFTVGVVWLFDYFTRVKSGDMKWFVWFVTVVVFCMWLVMVKVDPAMMILVGMSVLGMIGYRYGISKTFVSFFGGLTAFFILIILNAPHRMSRIENWWEMIITGVSFARPAGIDLMISKMHEGLFAYNEWGGLALVVVTLLYVWLITNIWRVESYFTKGIAIILTVDISFHIINFFGLSFVKPPVLFMMEYEKSITFVSFLMIGMVIMASKRDKEQK